MQCSPPIAARESKSFRSRRNHQDRSAPREYPASPRFFRNMEPGQVKNPSCNRNPLSGGPRFFWLCMEHPGHRFGILTCRASCRPLHREAVCKLLLCATGDVGPQAVAPDETDSAICPRLFQGYGNHTAFRIVDDPINSGARNPLKPLAHPRQAVPCFRFKARLIRGEGSLCTCSALLCDVVLVHGGHNAMQDVPVLVFGRKTRNPTEASMEGASGADHLNCVPDR